MSEISSPGAPAKLSSGKKRSTPAREMTKLSLNLGWGA